MPQEKNQRVIMIILMEFRIYNFGIPNNKNNGFVKV
jgi:hypothetical protein